MSHDVKICGACGSGLSFLEGPDDRAEYIHIVPTEDGHEPAPVNPGEVEAHPICDFCSIRVSSDEVWTCLAGPMSTRIGNVESRSDDAWAACPACAQDILNERWSRMLTRSARRLSLKHTDIPYEMILTGVGDIHAQFRRARVGDPFKGMPLEYRRDA